jgi:nucleoid DNA-binding protein
MPIEYAVTSNALTTPPSFGARPAPKQILDYDAVGRAIQIHNPTITSSMAVTVLKALREEVIYQLAEGNTINLEGFCSFVVSMKVRLDAPTDPLPSQPIDIKAKPSAPFKTAIRQAASYFRLPAVTKAPNIISAVDTNTQIEGYVRNGFGAQVNGSNVGFNPLAADEGVFLLSSAGNSTRQINLSLNNPSQLIYTPLLDVAAGPAGANSVEQILTVNSRYTTSGQLRSGTAGKPLRTTNVVEDGAISLFVVGAAASGPATVTSYLGAQVDARIIAQIKSDGVLALQIGTLAGVFGQSLDVLANGAYVLTGLAADVEVTVSDLVTLTASVLSYQRYMQEVINISPLTP